MTNIIICCGDHAPHHRMTGARAWRVARAWKPPRTCAACTRRGRSTLTSAVCALVPPPVRRVRCGASSNLTTQRHPTQPALGACRAASSEQRAPARSGRPVHPRAGRGPASPAATLGLRPGATTYSRCGVREPPQLSHALPSPFRSRDYLATALRHVRATHAARSHDVHTYAHIHTNTHTHTHAHRCPHPHPCAPRPRLSARSDALSAPHDPPRLPAVGQLRAARRRWTMAGRATASWSRTSSPPSPPLPAPPAH